LKLAEEMTDICVVYLARAKSGTASFRSFLESYRRWPAGLKHELLIVFKGFHSKQDTAPLVSLAREFQPRTLSMADFGFDLRAYGLALRHFKHDYFCFLNSFSEIQAEDWLAKMYAFIQRPEVGLVGTTASQESMYTNVLIERAKRRQPTLLQQIWTPVRLRLCQICFDPFPNYHLRTNGIMIPRRIARKVWPRYVLTKRRAYLFENGKKSLTKRVLGLQLGVLVVGKDGKGYEPKRWWQSRTFRQGRQENLLISDNQTRQYTAADFQTRSHLSILAWGDRADPGPDVGDVPAPAS